VTRTPRRPESADLDFTATVEAKELRFDEAPKTSVVFTGGPDYRSASGSDRTNLPARVEEEVTYRDVRVDYSIFSKLIDPPLPGPHDQTH
jgi:hypothetical protein